jgi:hypothetical protein
MAVRPRYGAEAAMKNALDALVACGIALALTALLGGCSSTPVPPEWQANAFSSLKSYTTAYLAGNTRVADFEFQRAKTEIARTGRPDLWALAELTRCATRVASLELGLCAAYQPWAQDATPAARAYAAFLQGQWTALDPALLPAHYRPLLAFAPQVAPSESVLSTIEDPLARLVGAGALLQTAALTPADIAVATDTASSQGWRRPLLAWLGVQLKRARDAGDLKAVAAVERRIELLGR